MERHCGTLSQGTPEKPWSWVGLRMGSWLENGKSTLWRPDCYSTDLSWPLTATGVGTGPARVGMRIDDGTY